MIWSKKNYKWYYDNIQSKKYDVLTKIWFLPFGGENKFRTDMISDIIFLPKENILDMCCGSGNVTFVVAKKIDKESNIIGIDLSTGQIKAANNKVKGINNIRFLEGDVSKTQFINNEFTKVFISHAIHEMKRELRQQVLREAYRILQKNGQVIVLELDNPNNYFIRLFIGIWFFYWLPFNFETPTRREMLKNGLDNEVKEAGFSSINKISKFKNVFQVVIGTKKIKAPNPRLEPTWPSAR
jgi:ubiquinone/menaquinone biosynthesis C-methylase UbiE